MGDKEKEEAIPFTDDFDVLSNKVNEGIANVCLFLLFILQKKIKKINKFQYYVIIIF